MMLFWKSRYFDRTEKQFKSRCLFLDTQSLDPLLRATVELIARNQSSQTERDIIKYRHLFALRQEEELTNAHEWDEFKSVNPSDYFEDESGKEIMPQELGALLTGSPTARLIPRGAKPHDIALMFSQPTPLPIAEVSLSDDDVRLLGYFVRDLNELTGSAFMKDGPGTLHTVEFNISPSSNTRLETAATDDEIRSFVTIFRRLYMTGVNDPASFTKILPIFTKALGEHPRAKWVTGVAAEYQNHLSSTPDARPFIKPGTCTFTTKRLIDVFLYTQYAHQPDKKEQQRFAHCLSEVHGHHAVLTWMFLSEIWKCALEISNAGRVISRWFKLYCDYHAVEPTILNSLRKMVPGLGGGEKDEARQERLFQEQAEKLAVELWEQAGCPQGGSSQYLTTAREQLARMIQTV